MVPAITISCDRTNANIAAQLRRMRGEFREMPGLRLSLEQAQRLWGLDREVCACLLGMLVDEGFLRRRSNATYGLNTNDW